MIFSRTIFHVEWPWQKLLGWTQQRHSIKKKEEKQPNNNGYSLTILLDIYFMLQTLHQFI